MSQPPDPRVTGLFQSAGKAGPDKIPQTPGSVPSDLSGRLILSQTSARVPVVIPADKKKKPASGPEPIVFPALKQLKKFHKLDRRATWYIVLIVGILTIVLGFAFTVPLNTGQQDSTTAAQGIVNLITNGQSGNMSSQSQGQGQGQSQSQTQITPGYPGSGTSGTRLFSNKSPWNLPIGTNVQIDPASGTMVNELTDCCHVPAMFDFGMPIYTSTASDPTYNVQDNDGAFQANQPIHIPNDAAPSPGSDHWMFIYDKTKNMVFEMWGANKSGNSWSAQTGDVYSPTGDGVLQVDGSQQSGNGSSYFGGVVTDADIARGYIDHALSFASQATSSSFRYPMNASDGGGGDVPMGARIQLNPSVNCNTLPGASAGEKMVCQALETYGGYMRDTGGVTLSMYFEGEDLNDPNRNPPDGSPGNAGRSGGVFGRVGLQDGQDLGEIPWNKLRVLKSWDSFTALGNTNAPGPLLHIQTTGARTLLSTPIYSTLGLSDIRPMLIGEAARPRYWSENNRYASSTPALFRANQFLALRNRLLLLRRLHY